MSNLRILLLVIVLFLPYAAFAGSQTFTTSGTFTVPNFISLTVTVNGAGGQGGPCHASLSGAAGTASSFNSVVIGNGGGGGGHMNGGGVGASGTASGGTTNTTGGGAAGGAAYPSGSCGFATYAGGPGGQAIKSYGSGNLAVGNGIAVVIGTGGSGSGGSYPGSPGTNGSVVITWTEPTLTINGAVTVNGDLNVTGALSKSSGSFVIDHPLDPKNKLLYHSFVESPEVMNTYVGRARLDNTGRATITLPNYFLPLNKDFRYFATPIGTAMPNLYLSVGVRPRFFGLFGTPEFSIAGGAPGAEVSWMVTGVRHDPYILANPVIPQVRKGAGAPYAQGTYMHPELYTASTTRK